MSLTLDALQQRLDGIRNLPTLPAVYGKLQGVIRDDRSSAKDVGRVVEEDPALTARLLKMVNSAFYGMPREITTVDQAVVILGLRELEHAVLATSILKVFPGRGSQALFDLHQFWKHALGTAVAAREVARRFTRGNPHEAFTMGLLHDIGKVVLNLFFFDEYVPVLEQVRQRNEAIGTVEQDVLGFTHADVGAILAAKWDLPPRIVEVIQHHHTPAASEHCAEAAAVVNLADMLCRAMGWGFPGDPLVPALADDARERVGIRPEDVASLLQATDEQYHDALAILALP